MLHVITKLSPTAFSWFTISASELVLVALKSNGGVFPLAFWVDVDGVLSSHASLNVMLDGGGT